MAKEDLFITPKLDMTNNTSRTQIDQNISLPSLSRDIRLRLKWIKHYQKYRSARLTCRHFGISPDTFYLWKRRFDSKNLQTLGDDKKNRRPKNLRKRLAVSLNSLTKNYKDNTL